VRVPSPALDQAVSLDSVFAPVRSQTAFEETVERLGTAIRLGLLPPGSRLPSERELCKKLDIARSTLRQALTALTEGGLLRAVRGRGGGTFVVEELPPAAEPSDETWGDWREVCDERLAVEVGVCVLATERASAQALAPLDALVVAMDGSTRDYPSYRQADVRFHIGLAEATGSARLVAAMTDAQAGMTALISHIAHPADVLARSNAQHARLLAAIRSGDAAHAMQVATEHAHDTEHVLEALLPAAHRAT
jgi:DNA-binding FadR family transcriptional regulator